MNVKEGVFIGYVHKGFVILENEPKANIPGSLMSLFEWT